MKKIILIGIVAILIAIQFITIDKNNPPVDNSKDFITLNDPPNKILNLIKNSCYDCHSNETKYPWYSDVAPFSWLIKKHINNARSHLNFSTWSDYNEEKKKRKIDECIEEIKYSKMPMEAYVLFHPESEMTGEQRRELIYWFDSIEN